MYVAIIAEDVCPIRSRSTAGLIPAGPTADCIHDEIFPSKANEGTCLGSVRSRRTAEFAYSNPNAAAALSRRARE